MSAFRSSGQASTVYPSGTAPEIYQPGTTVSMPNQPQPQIIMPPRRKHKRPCKFKIGDRIRPISMFDQHTYFRDESYEVIHIDPNDQTLRARDEKGDIGTWIRWRDCEASDEIGWEWLKGQLPAEILELLSAFDGLGTLKLRADLRAALIQEIPSLKARILDVAVAQNASPDHDHQ